MGFNSTIAGSSKASSGDASFGVEIPLGHVLVIVIIWIAFMMISLVRGALMASQSSEDRVRADPSGAKHGLKGAAIGGRFSVSCPDLFRVRSGSRLSSLSSIPEGQALTPTPPEYRASYLSLSSSSPNLTQHGYEDMDDSVGARSDLLRELTRLSLERDGDDDTDDDTDDDGGGGGGGGGPAEGACDEHRRGDYDQQGLMECGEMPLRGDGESEAGEHGGGGGVQLPVWKGPRPMDRSRIQPEGGGFDLHHTVTIGA